MPARWSPVSARPRTDEDRRDCTTGTLGDLLYAGKAKIRVSEEDWVRLVRSVAAGDQLALHALYERTHRIAFTLIMRITNNRETAEELTLDVFHDVWRRASKYDAAGGTVVGWIMNQARCRAIDRLRLNSGRSASTLMRTAHFRRVLRVTPTMLSTSASRGTSCEVRCRSSRRTSDR